MSRPRAFRLFLMLALLLNGLVSAHAAVAHALMSLPAAAPAMQSTAVSVAKAAAMEEGCHDMAGHAASDMPATSHAQTAPDHPRASSCCQGTVCNCACALQLPLGPPAFAVTASWQPLPVAQAADAWLSITPSLILRPPIA